MGKRVTKSLLLGLLLLWVPAGFAAATAQAESDSAADLLTQAKALYGDKEYKEALTLLQRALRQDPGNVDISFLMGLAAMRIKDYEAAAVAFDRVLFMRPDSDRARLELARAYAYLGLHDMAEKLFTEVAEKPDTPTTVRRRIKGYLQDIGKAKREHSIGGTLSISLVRDDNARVSPGGTVHIPGLPNLNTSEEGDWFTAQTLALSYRWQPRVGTLGWNADLLGYNAFYHHEDDLDVNYIRFDTGPQWSWRTWSIGLSGNASFMEKDYDRYLGTYGARAWSLVKLSSDVDVYFEWLPEQRHYWQVPDADGFSNTFSLMPVYTHGRHRLAGEMGWERHNADKGYEAYDRLFAGVVYQVRLPWRLTLSGGYRYENWLFDDPEALASSRRRDSIHEFTVDVRKRLTRKLTVAIRHKYEKANSNSALYDYDRNVTSLTMSYTF